MEKLEHAKDSIRAKVEHPFPCCVVKNLFGHRKARCWLADGCVPLTAKLRHENGK